MPELAEEQIGAPVAEGPAAPGPSAPNVITLPSGEVVTLYPEVTIQLGVAAMMIAKAASRRVIALAGPFGDIESAVVEGQLAEIYLRFGIKSWTFVEDGLPVPVSPENIERFLPYGRGGREVAEAADALYSDEVFRPFREAQATLLALMRTVPPTSPPSANGLTPPTPLRPSSRNGTAGKRSGGRGRSPGKKRT